jgi:hypothetical protein
MKIIITEQQKRMILTESTGENLGNVIKQNTKRIKTIIEEAQGQIGMNLQFLLTWGAGIGGFMGPVEDFVRGKYPEIDESELVLILIGVIATYFIDNKKIITKIYTKIQEEGLSKVFDNILKKTDILRQTFVNFIDSLGLTFHKITNMLSYTFIIPLLPMIYQMVEEGSTENIDLKQLAIRIISFTGLTLSGIIFKELLTKLVKRFKS